MSKIPSNQNKGLRERFEKITTLFYDGTSNSRGSIDKEEIWSFLEEEIEKARKEMKQECLAIVCDKKIPGKDDSFLVFSIRTAINMIK